MKRTIQLSALLLAALMIACTGGSEKKETSDVATVSITHSQGTVQVPYNPQRVAVLDFSALEDLDYLGIKPVAVPKTGLPRHLAKYRDDASIMDAGTVVEVNLEKINEANPDLIIIGNRLRDFYNDLSKIAPVIIQEATGSEDFVPAFRKNLSDMSKVFGHEEELNNAFAAIETKMEKVKTEAEKAGLKALIILHNRGRFSAYGSGSRFGIIHDALGVPEAQTGLGTHTHGNPVSGEYIQKVNPDILFIVDRSQVVENEVLDKNEVENKLIQQTNAYKNNRIVYLNPETWYLSGAGIYSVNAMIDEVEKIVLR